MLGQKMRPNQAEVTRVANDVQQKARNLQKLVLENSSTKKLPSDLTDELEGLAGQLSTMVSYSQILEVKDQNFANYISECLN